MAQDKISMPTSTAGITRYTDDYKSAISFKPHYVFILVALILIIIIILHVYGHTWLGIPSLT